MITSTPNTLQDYSDLPPAAPVKPGGYIPEHRPTLDNLNHNLNALPDLLSSPQRILPINQHPTRPDSAPGFPVRTLNTPRLNSPSTVLQSAGKAKRTFPCTVPGCGKVFTKIQSLKIHSHLHTQEPFYCNVPSCNQSFPNNSQLIKHKREVHRLHPPTQKTFQCTVCFKSLAKEENLVYHMNRHLNFTPFECRVAGCNKSFYSPYPRRKHEIKHTQQSRSVNPASNHLAQTL